MLNSLSLRLGNLIARAETNESTGLTTNVPVTVDLEILTAIHNRPNPPYKGIVLTEEWLLRLGFVKHHDSGLYKNGDFYLHQYRFPGNSYCFQYNDFKSAEIRFVHELMNLYCSMVGKELTVKL